MYSYFRICWINQTITIEQLQNAVALGFITAEQYEVITKL